MRIQLRKKQQKKQKHNKKTSGILYDFILSKGALQLFIYLLIYFLDLSHAVYIFEVLFVVPTSLFLSSTNHHFIVTANILSSF